MKFLFFILAFIYLSCYSPSKSYEQALIDCDDKSLPINNKNPKFITSVSPSCLIGAKIPNFEAYTTDNHKIDFSYFEDKITILNFWLIGCAPCLAEIPGLNKIKDRFKDRNVNFLAIGRDDQQDIEKFLTEHLWSFEQIRDGRSIIENVFKNKWGYPTTLILDKEMKIIEAFSGGPSDTFAIIHIQNRIIPVLEKELNKQ